MKLSTAQKTWGKWHPASKGKRKSEETRFWIKVDIRGDNDCWPWLAGSMFQTSEGNVTPVRYAWGFASGNVVPHSLKVLHKNWGQHTGKRTRTDYCCNPRHLYAVIETHKSIRFLKKQLKWSWNWSHCLQLFYNYVDNDITTECWNWTGDTKVKGYGRFVMKEMSQTRIRYWAVHRLSWMLANSSSLDDKDHIHHTCRNKGCINPDHLVKMSNKEHGELHGKEVKEVWDLVKAKHKIL